MTPLTSNDFRSQTPPKVKLNFEKQLMLIDHRPQKIVSSCKNKIPQYKVLNNCL